MQTLRITGRRILAAGLPLAAVFFVLLWVSIRPGKPSAAALALDRKLVELRTRGEPLTADDIATRFPDPPPDRDAQTLLQAAFSFSPAAPVTTNVPAVSAQWPGRSRPLDDDVKKDIGAYLGNYRSLLDSIPDDLTGVRFSPGWTNGITNLVKMPLVQVRSLFQMLALTALYAAERQDMESAGTALRKGFALTGIINDEVLVNEMIRTACVGLLCDATERVLNRGPLAEKHLAVIAARVSPEVSSTLSNALTVEKYLGLEYLNSVRVGLTNGTIQHLSLETAWHWIRGYRAPLYREEDHLLFIEATENWMSALGLPGAIRVRRNEEIERHYVTNIYSSTAELLMRYWTKVARSHCEAQARVATVQAAIAIERYRKTHRTELPGSLDKLVPQCLSASPRDPMDNQPLRFKKLTRGFVVYSIGPDGIDNGGIERSPSVTNNYDVTFTVER